MLPGTVVLHPYNEPSLAYKFPCFVTLIGSNTILKQYVNKLHSCHNPSLIATFLNTKTNHPASLNYLAALLSFQNGGAEQTCRVMLLHKFNHIMANPKRDRLSWLQIVTVGYCPVAMGYLKATHVHCDSICNHHVTDHDLLPLSVNTITI